MTISVSYVLKNLDTGQCWHQGDYHSSPIYVHSLDEVERNLAQYSLIQTVDMKPLTVVRRSVIKTVSEEVVLPVGQSLLSEIAIAALHLSKHDIAEVLSRPTRYAPPSCRSLTLMLHSMMKEQMKRDRLPRYASLYKSDQLAGSWLNSLGSRVEGDAIWKQASRGSPWYVLLYDHPSVPAQLALVAEFDFALVTSYEFKSIDIDESFDLVEVPIED